MYRCGVEFRPTPSPHYSGNFFWSNCRHVASIPGLWDPLNNFSECEFFILMSQRARFHDTCGFEPFHTEANHYKDRCPRDSFIRSIEKLVTSYSLPMPKDAKALSLCNNKNMSQESYNDSDDYKACVRIQQDFHVKKGHSWGFASAWEQNQWKSKSCDTIL
jgi:hypothetical protein